MHFGTELQTRVWSRSWLAPKSINMRLVGIHCIFCRYKYHISTMVYSPAKSIIYRLGFKIAGKADFPTLKLDNLRHMMSQRFSSTNSESVTKPISDQTYRVEIKIVTRRSTDMNFRIELQHGRMARSLFDKEDRSV